MNVSLLGVLKAVPQVREMERARWKPPGWRVTACSISEGAVSLTLEAE